MDTNSDNSIRERVTPQRQAILDFLEETKIHPTAKQIHEEVKEKLPHISLGTVYRNLEELVKEGKVQKISGEENRYDGNTSFHAHFICDECGKVYDVPLDWEEIDNVEVGEVNNCQVIFHGVCNNCK